MNELEFQLIKSTGFVIALVVALLIQRWRPHRALDGSWRANGALWVIDAVLLGALCTGCACTVSQWASHDGFGLLNLVGLPPWASIFVSVIALDFVSYAWHRANHRVPWLWRFHQAHHSDSEFTVTTALRFHPGELLLALPVRLAAVAVLGVPIFAVIVFEVIFAFANFAEHGDINLSRGLEQRIGRLFITPALHRRHHAREAALLDTNYGTILSVWDRAFGSFGENASTDVVDTGLPGTKRSMGFVDVLTLPVRGGFGDRTRSS